jgi:hypothetical protein
MLLLHELELEAALTKRLGGFKRWVNPGAGQHQSVCTQIVNRLLLFGLLVDRRRGGGSACRLINYRGWRAAVNSSTCAPPRGGMHGRPSTNSGEATTIAPPPATDGLHVSRDTKSSGQNVQKGLRELARARIFPAQALTASPPANCQSLNFPGTVSQSYASHSSNPPPPPSTPHPVTSSSYAGRSKVSAGLWPRPPSGHAQVRPLQFLGFGKIFLAVHGASAAVSRGIREIAPREANRQPSPTPPRPPIASQFPRTVRVAATRDLWLPGSDAPAHLDGRRVLPWFSARARPAWGNAAAA